MIIEKKFKEVLDKTIEKVFENENAFLSRFLSKYKNIELISFYMSSNSCEAHCCDMKSGNHFFYDIDTNDFIEWVNNLNKEQSHIAQTCEKCGASNVRAAVQMCSVDPDSDEVCPGSALWR